MGDCSSLAIRNDYSSYISLLLTDNAEVNVTLLQHCKAQVCTALWGEGNPDVSGVGMIVGYIMEHALGLLIAGLAASFSTLKIDRPQKLFRASLDRFHESAAFLCFSIQTAAIVVLVKEDAGISTAGMGDGSVRITEAVSVLTLLPLAYAVVILKPVERQTTESEEVDGPPEETPGLDRDIEETKRVGVTAICWLMAFYPFYSKMNNVFGPSEISNAPGSAIGTDQFSQVAAVCLDGVEAITSDEDNLMTALIIMSYIPMSILVLSRIVKLALKKHHLDSRFYQKASSGLHEWPMLRWIVLGFLGAIPLLGSGLIWTVFRVQHFQTQLASKTKAEDADSQWTFGQVVAVTVFAPVFVDAWFRARDSWSKPGDPDSARKVKS